MRSKQILVVDDEKKLTDVICSYLEKAEYEVLTAHDCHQARMIFERKIPDLMILDLMLPDQSGESFCKEIRKKSNLPIIMLTAKSAETDFLNGLELGADDYITKPFSVRQLVAKVGALIRRAEMNQTTDSNGSATMKSEWIVQGGLSLSEDSREVYKAGKLIATTPNEFRILSCLMRNPTRVFTRDVLIATALGSDFEGFDRTVDSYIKTLRQKIEDDSKKPKYIVTVHGVGYRFGGENA